MKGKRLNTIGLILLTLMGLGGVFLSDKLGPFAFPFSLIGFVGFPILYGYITWPVGKRLPDREWIITIGIMALFAAAILYRQF